MGTDIRMGMVTAVLVASIVVALVIACKPLPRAVRRRRGTSTWDAWLYAPDGDALPPRLQQTAGTNSSRKPDGFDRPD